MSLGVRDDDAPLALWLRGANRARDGVSRAGRATSKPQVRWLVRTQADCRALVDLLDRYELRGRKRREYRDLADRRGDRGVRDRGTPPRDCGAGSQLNVSRRSGPFAHQDRTSWPRLRRIATRSSRICTGCCAPRARSACGRPTPASASIFDRTTGRCWRCWPARPGSGISATPVRTRRRDASTFWRVSSAADVVQMASWLDPVLMRGRKAKELRVWLGAVAELQRARAADRRVNLAARLAAFKAARRYRPPSNELPPREPQRDIRAEDMAALQRWAATERGALSCRCYAAYRKDIDPTAPNRNTLARRFGSWNAALEAARSRGPCGFDRRGAPRPNRRRCRGSRGSGRSPARAGARDAPVRRQPSRQPADRDAVLPLAARGGAGHPDAGHRVSPLPRRLARRARGL